MKERVTIQSLKDHFFERKLLFANRFRQVDVVTTVIQSNLACAYYNERQYIFTPNIYAIHEIITGTVGVIKDRDTMEDLEVNIGILTIFKGLRCKSMAINVVII